MTRVNGCHSTNRVSLDVVFETLSDTMRRRILVALLTENSRSVDEFETVEVTPEQTERGTTSIALRHTHLPKLDEAEFIDWDRETGQTTRGENFGDIRPLLELIDDHRDDLPDDWP